MNVSQKSLASLLMGPSDLFEQVDSTSQLYHSLLSFSSIILIYFIRARVLSLSLLFIVSCIFLLQLIDVF
jgi:hypothetical protein